MGNTGVLPHLDQTQKHSLNEQFLHCGHHLGVMFLKKILHVVLRGFFNLMYMVSESAL